MVLVLVDGCVTCTLDNNNNTSGGNSNGKGKKMSDKNNGTMGKGKGLDKVRVILVQHIPAAVKF